MGWVEWFWVGLELSSETASSRDSRAKGYSLESIFSTPITTTGFSLRQVNVTVYLAFPVSRKFMEIQDICFALVTNNRNVELYRQITLAAQSCFIHGPLSEPFGIIEIIEEKFASRVKFFRCEKEKKNKE